MSELCCTLFVINTLGEKTGEEYYFESVIIPHVGEELCLMPSLKSFRITRIRYGVTTNHRASAYIATLELWGEPCPL